MHPHPRLKTHRRYHFYRAWCLFFAVLWNVIGFYEFFAMAGRHQPPVIMPLLFPLAFPTIFMILSWGAFPWNYSLFGRYERTPPKEGSFLRSPKLSHDWPELRSPVILPKPVFEALRAAVAKYGPAGAAPAACGEVDNRPILP